MDSKALAYPLRFPLKNAAARYPKQSAAAIPPAAVMSAYVVPAIRKNIIKNAIFIGSGAMMSPDMIKQGKNIPAVGHLILLER